MNIQKNLPNQSQVSIFIFFLSQNSRVFSQVSELQGILIKFNLNKICLLAFAYDIRSNISVIWSGWETCFMIGWELSVESRANASARSWMRNIESWKNKSKLLNKSINFFKLVNFT